MFLRLMVLCCLIAFLSPAWASEGAMMDAILFPSGHIERGNSLDDPQPDTIRYDDNTPALLNSGTNFWTRVRFNAPYIFELRSIYFYSTNGDGGAEPCTVRVYEANGANFGALRSQHVMAGSVVNFGWNDTNLPEPEQFAAGDTFYVVIGRVPGGQQAAGWHVIMDNANVGRSGFGTSLTGNYTNSGGDYMLRAGGAVETFTDLEATECYNDVNSSGPEFNFLSGGTVGLSTVVTNAGNSTIDLYTVHWTVTGPGGGEVFSDEVAAGPITDGAVQTIETQNTFAAAADGEYMVECFVTADGDAVPDNDATYLRFFVGGLHRWYRYDDNQVPDSYIGFTPGNGWGVAFTPTMYTAQIESVRVGVGADGNGDFRLYLNGEDGLPGGNPLWTSTAAVVTGWNTIAVNPPVQVFLGETVTLAYLYSGLAFGKDDNAPNVSGILGMGGNAFQAADDGGTWVEDNSGNWCMQVYFDSSNQAPPFPLIDTNLDTMNFGMVDTAASVQMTLWIYNEGGQDPLTVSNMVINPPAIRTSYSLSRTNIPSIAAGDSEDVVVTFNPVNIATYNGLIAITNNSDNEPTKNIRLLGSGGLVAADDPHEGLPSQFALSQNFPNPFNPSTEITFALPQASSVRLAVYNTLGQEVRALAAGMYDAGYHSVSFDAAELPAGLYFYRIEAGDFTAIRKMMLLK